MSKLLTTKDYVDILQFYKLQIPENKTDIKKMAEHIMANKLCKCIKKITSSNTMNNEARSIGICTKTILNRKGYTRGKFNCLGKQSVSFLKNKNKTKSKLTKSTSIKTKTRKQYTK
jgi:hypothetical protein